MVAALHAQRILEAWDVTSPEQRDAGRFEIELASALRSCRSTPPANALENEQQAVLESVAQNLSSLSSGSRRPPQLEAGLSLLRHLSTRIQ